MISVEKRIKSSVQNYTCLLLTAYVFVFVSSSWNLPYSALCAYNLEDIDAIIDGKSFPQNKTEFYSSSSGSHGRYYDGKSAFYPGQVAEIF